MQFVGDILWSSPLGLYINAQDRGGIAQTTDWVKVRGDQLKPRDGLYDVRITADLWETHYFDHVHLTVVDHPADTEIYRRRALLPHADHAAAVRHQTAAARRAGRGRAGRRRDRRHSQVSTAAISTPSPSASTRASRADHYVEVDLGDDAPKTGPVYLLATGWIHPTDSSINVAIEQGSNDRPHGLVLEVPDGKGGWTVGRPALGFPAGKNKTIVIRLDDIPGREGVARRFRLRTNMEIYWDAWNTHEGSTPARRKANRPDGGHGDLRHRGICHHAGRRQFPELPDYDKLVTSGRPGATSSAGTPVMAMSANYWKRWTTAMSS